MRKLLRPIEGLILACLCAAAFVLVAHGISLAAASVSHNQGFAPNDACVGNMRLLGQALTQYGEDNDELLPPAHTTQEFQAALLPFVKDPAHFVCPDTGLAYTFNAAISGKFIGSFSDSEKTEVARDTQPHQDELLTVLFLDGHVERGGVEAGDPNALSYSHAKELSLGVMQYTQDWDEFLPPTDTQAHFEAALLPYTRSHLVFVDLRNGKPFVPNPAISGVTVFSITDPATTELFRDDHPYPDGTPLIAYADGHVTPLLTSIPGSGQDPGNMKQIGLALIQYTQDNDENLPPTNDYSRFENALLPYTANNTDLFTTPDTDLPYSLNPATSGQSLASIADPSQTEELRDPQRHSDGTLNTLYVDGHVFQTQFYVPTGLTVGPDNETHLLWPKVAGELQAALWTLNSEGNVQTQMPYTLASGARAVTFSIGGDGRTHLLWALPYNDTLNYNFNIGSASGKVALETIGADGSVESQQTYGPYDGWTPLYLTTGEDNASRLLWRRYDGTYALWRVTPEGQYLSDIRLHPKAGLTAAGLARGSDSLTRLLWKTASGAASLWTLSDSGQQQRQVSFQPHSGFALTALGLGPDNRPRLLWNDGTGQAEVWTLTPHGQYIGFVTFHLAVGWTATALGVGQKGDLRVLWTSADGSGRLQALRPDGTAVSVVDLTPYQ